MPSNTTVLTPLHFKMGSTGVPKNASGRYSGSTMSPVAGFSSSMNSQPGVPSTASAGCGPPAFARRQRRTSDDVRSPGRLVVRRNNIGMFFIRAAAMTSLMSEIRPRRESRDNTDSRAEPHDHDGLDPVPPQHSIEDAAVEGELPQPAHQWVRSGENLVHQRIHQVGPNPRLDASLRLHASASRRGAIRDEKRCRLRRARAVPKLPHWATTRRGCPMAISSSSQLHLGITVATFDTRINTPQRHQYREGRDRKRLAGPAGRDFFTLRATSCHASRRCISSASSRMRASSIPIQPLDPT